jgi:thiosulfate/3-mercaptopyruvate sulfurtransferase
LVVYGDGGPEPYRLWWTLRSMTGLETRVLDGGLHAWKAAGHRVAGGDGLEVAAGDVGLGSPQAPFAEHWSDISAFMESRQGVKLIDTRSDIEFTGEEKHPKAARAGRIPGALHLDWGEVLRDKDGDHRLKAPSELRELFATRDIEAGAPVVTYCQSGTRSAAVYYALYQLGHAASESLNYDGSWAEYSRLDLPVEP